MIFDNIMFHNVEDMQLCEKGYRMWRVPQWVRENLNETARVLTSGDATGVELRFKMKSDKVTLFFAADNMKEAQVAYIYYGSLQGGFTDSSRVILTDKTAVEISKPSNMDLLKQLSQEYELPFNPEVVRVILPYGVIYYLGMEGEVEPPLQEDLPDRTYLAYGSSITHGSLALGTPYSYPFRLSQKIKCDYINLAFSGSAHMEKVMADYIVSRKDWDFATLEMGVNMLGEEAGKFDRIIDEFTKKLSEDSRPVFATSVYGFSNPDLQASGVEKRAIVEKYAKDRFTFVDGLEFLNNPVYISQDTIHPTLEGMDQITDKWYEILRGGKL